MVLRDLLPVQPLKGIHVTCVLPDPEDLAYRLSFEHILGVLAVHTRFDLGKKRRHELRMGRGGRVRVSVCTHTCECASVCRYVSVYAHTCMFVHMCVHICGAGQGS